MSDNKLHPDDLAKYDGDARNQGLSRVYGTVLEDGSISRDPISSVCAYDFSHDDERCELLNSAAHPALVTLHDLPGGCIADIQKICDGGNGVQYLLDDFASVQRRPTLLHVLDNEIEATQSVSDWLDLVGDRADHVAVLNMRECTSVDDFLYWRPHTTPSGVVKGGKTRKRFLDLGGVEIQMPKLNPRIRSRMNAEKLTFAAALKSEDLLMVEKSNIRRYRNEFANAIAPARQLLGLDGETRRSIWSVNNKGGVGKSLFIRSYVDHVIGE